MGITRHLIKLWGVGRVKGKEERERERGGGGGGWEEER